MPETPALTAARTNTSELTNAGGKSPAEVREMFSRVARRYDLLNHLLSLGLDIVWRRRAAKEARGLHAGDLIVDLCTGTGDLAFALHNQAPESRIFALDFTPEMAAYGPVKAKRKRVEQIAFAVADALRIPVGDAQVALVSVAFGIRNVGSLSGCLAQMHRVLKPGGKALVLEFTKPSGHVFGPLYLFYLNRVLPLVGVLLAWAAGDAYRYLPRSIQAFAGPREMAEEMQRAGFTDVQAISLTFGTVHLYVGRRATGTS